MKELALLLLLLTGCELTPTGDVILKNVKQPVRRYHDDSLHVSCWVTVSGQGDGIFCIPDHDLHR